MSLLCDADIEDALSRGEIAVDPYDPGLLQPCSLDVRVSDQFRVFRNHYWAVIDPTRKMEGLTELIRVHEALVLHPGEFVLASTLETFSFGDRMAGKLEGKSSLGRLGLTLHATAGFIDPGFVGDLTLELSNISNLPILVYPEMPIGQVAFCRLERAARKAYGKVRGSKYQGQRGPTESAYWKNFVKTPGGDGQE